MWAQVEDLVRWAPDGYNPHCWCLGQSFNTHSCPFAGGWWWLWCVLHHYWRKSDHIPHLQQVLLPPHRKTAIVWCILSRFPFPNVLSLPFCTRRTHTASVSTFGRPCSTSRRFSRQTITRGQWKTEHMPSWKMERSTYEGKCGSTLMYLEKIADCTLTLHKLVIPLTKDGIYLFWCFEDIFFWWRVKYVFFSNEMFGFFFLNSNLWLTCM